MAHNIDRLFVSLGEKTFVHELAHDTDTYTIQPLSMSKTLIRLRRNSPNAERSQRILRVISRDHRQYFRGILHRPADRADAGVNSSADHPVPADQFLCW